jgi:lysophospholipase L1-like esterase
VGQDRESRGSERAGRAARNDVANVRNQSRLLVAPLVVLLFVVALLSLIGSAAGAGSKRLAEHHESDVGSPTPGHLTAVPHFSGTGAAPAGARPASTGASRAPSPPYRECPAVGADQSCGILIYVTSSGAQVLSDPSQGPYDGGDDTLVGVLNASGKTLSSISLSSGSDAFGFDGDGICTYSGWTGDEKCPYGPTGYEGPGTHFSVTNGNSGQVVLTPKLAASGGSAYFGLENALSNASLVNTRAYAAIGDSYSAGVGTEDSSFSATCDRGPKAWPMFLGSYAGLTIKGSPSSPPNSFFACSGATSSQELNGDAGNHQPNQVSELEKYALANGTPGLVTITAGGNDVKFADLLETCYIWGGHACASALKEGINYLTSGQKSFEQRLQKLYQGAVKAAGSGARIDVVGYPRIFPESLGWLQLLHHCDWLATVPSGLSLIHELTIDLDNDIRQAAGNAHVGFASTENAMAGHELCTGDSWLASIGFINGKVKHISGHPELRGQEEMARTVLNDLTAGGQPLGVRRGSKTANRTAVIPAATAKRHTVRLAEGALKISSAETPAATVGGPYLGYLLASGGTEPYTWSISKDSLPSGLTLDPNTGVISGEPTATGTSKFTVTVSDSASPANTASKALTISATAPATLAISTSSLPVATAGQQYETTLATAGGTQPVSWKLETGTLPTGVSLDSETGTISGTPSGAGKTTVTVGGTDSAEPAQSTTATLTLTTLAESEPLALIAPEPPAGKAGEYYGLALNSTGGVAPISWTVSAGTLPDGLTLDATTGEISGLPTSSGSYPVTVTATDRSTPTPRSASREFTIVIEAPSHVSILTPTIPAATQGSAYVTSLNAEGGVSGYSWQLSSGNLAPGLSLDSESGTIEGIPTESGSFTFTATVSDGSTPTAQSASATYTISVAASSPTISFSPPVATVNVPYSYTPTTGGGVEPYTWSVASGELPAGLTLDEATGTISGTPTTVGSSSVTLRLADSSQPVAQSITASATLSVEAAPPLQIESEGLPGATNGEPYRAVVFVSGGSEPYAFSITHGSLPAGVTLEPGSGVLAGIPETEGSFEVTLKVSDASNPSQSSSATFKLTVGAPPPLSIETSELAEATAGDNFSQALIAAGGTEPYRWSVTSGALPPGLSLSESSGEISGTPSEAGTFTFTVRASDSSKVAQSASVTLSLTVNPTSPLNIVTSSLASGTQGSYYNQVIEAQGGVTPYTFSLASSSLPEGLALDPNSGTIYGTPTSFGTASFTVQMLDSSSPSAQIATRKLTLKIEPAPPLTMLTSSLTSGTQGSYYEQSLGLSGGVYPYSASMTAGSLPEGLSIDQYGDIFGEITSSHTETFTISVHDGSTPHAQTLSRQFTIEVTPAAPLELAATVGSFVLGQYGDEQLGVSGGVPGYSWSVISSKLPAGLTFSGGYLYGTPSKKGKGTLTVKLSDSATPTANTVTKTITFSVVKAPKLKITTKKLPAAVHGSYYQQQIAVTGGSPGYSWSLSAGALPPGMSQSGEYIYGTPESAGAYQFTVKVTDSGANPQTATKKYTLKVS